MKTYIITYDIPSASVGGFRAKIKAIANGYGPIHSYATAIRTEKTAKEIRDLLRPSLPVGGRMFVIRSGTEAAWFNSYGKENDEWLKKNL